MIQFSTINDRYYVQLSYINQLNHDYVLNHLLHRLNDTMLRQCFPVAAARSSGKDEELILRFELNARINLSLENSGDHSRCLLSCRWNLRKMPFCLAHVFLCLSRACLGKRIVSIHR
jgi:hypothetical protein